jgi:hypothetical protein
MQSYSLHLQFEQKFGAVAWNLLFLTVEEELEDILKKTYEKINEKLSGLLGKPAPTNNNTPSNESTHIFLSRVVNLTIAEFNKKEMQI